MQTPDIPHDEADRLRVLASLDILDSDIEERFDRLTRIASRMFNVPIALVSLVDTNRQWFKSCTGLPVRETHRDISFCGHAILGDDTFIINDATQDHRFFDNPLVTGAPYIRFYVGRPIRTVKGVKIGTLCLIDSKPRIFTDKDIQDLNDLAAMVEKEIVATELATIDELTNLSNRRGFKVLAEKFLSLFARHLTACSLVLFDLNNFKTINDTYGHKEGDRALHMFGNALKQVGRSSDLFARLGGDEFIVLLANTRQAEALNYVQSLMRHLDSLALQQGLPYNISASHGVVEFNPQHPKTLEELLIEGDRLMYELKRTNEKASME